MKPTPYEVLKIALWLYNQSSAHPSNKKLEEFIPEAVRLLKMASDNIAQVK
jgi:hypothetical protein